MTAFTVSAEAATNPAPIVELYFTAFGRAPDTADLQYWVSAKQNGMSLGQITQAYTQAEEFAQSAKSDATSFLTTLFQNALGRAPDAAGLSYWTAQLANERDDPGSGAVIHQRLAGK